MSVQIQLKEGMFVMPDLESFVSQIPLSYRYRLEHAKVGEKVFVFHRNCDHSYFGDTNNRYEFFFEVEEVTELKKTGYKTSSGIFFSKSGRCSHWEYNGSICFEYSESVLWLKCYYEKLSSMVKFVNEKALNSSFEILSNWHPLLIGSFLQL